MNPTVLVTLAIAAVVACLLVGLLLTLLRERARSRALLEQTRAESAELRERLDALSDQVVAARQGGASEEYVITHLGEAVVSTGATSGHSSASEYGSTTGHARIDGRLFADVVLRETVVKAASLGHGVRRALAPESRNRIRFEMKHEVKARRKARRDDTRRVRRAMRDRRRAAARGQQEAATT